PSSVIPFVGSLSVVYARVFDRKSPPPPPVIPGVRVPKVSPKTNHVSPPASNIEPRSCPATSTRPVLFGEDGPVSCDTWTTSRTPASTNGAFFPTGSMFTREPPHATTDVARPAARRARPIRTRRRGPRQPVEARYRVLRFH